jgi:hypothetical protein
MPESPGLAGIQCTLVTPIYRESVIVDVERLSLNISGTIFRISVEYALDSSYLISEKNGYRFYFEDDVRYILCFSNESMYKYLTSRGVKAIDAINSDVFTADIDARVKIPDLGNVTGFIEIHKSYIRLRVNGEISWTLAYTDSRVNIVNGQLVVDNKRIEFLDSIDYDVLFELYREAYVSESEDIYVTLVSSEDTTLTVSYRGYVFIDKGEEKRLADDEIQLVGYSILTDTIDFVINRKLYSFGVDKDTLTKMIRRIVI